MYGCHLCPRARRDFFTGDAISSNQSVRRVNQLIDWSLHSQDLAPLWLALAWPWGKRLGTFNYPQQLLHRLNGQWVYHWGGAAWIIIESPENARVHSLHWKEESLTTGSPGKSELHCSYFASLHSNILYLQKRPARKRTMDCPMFAIPSVSSFLFFFFWLIQRIV